MKRPSEFRIVYPSKGGVCILTPSEECGLTVKEIAEKDVPPNVPYKIVGVDEIPTDRTFRGAWEYVE